MDAVLALLSCAGRPPQSGTVATIELSTHRPRKEGWLDKRSVSASLLKNWRHRWLVLVDDRIVWHREPPSSSSGEAAGELLFGLASQPKKNPSSMLRAARHNAAQAEASACDLATPRPTAASAPASAAPSQCSSGCGRQSGTDADDDAGWQSCVMGAAAGAPAAAATMWETSGVCPKFF